MTEKNVTVSKPLLAAVGAGDAVYAAALDVVTQVRERANSTDVTGGARERFANVPADVQAQFETLRERLSGLPSELPEDLTELREKFTAEELRALAEKYYKQVLDVYADLAVRGEETVDRLRANHLVEDRIERVEGLYKDATVRAEDVLGRVNGLLGRPVKEQDATVESVVEPLEPEVAPVVDAEIVADDTEFLTAQTVTAQPLTAEPVDNEPVGSGSTGAGFVATESDTGTTPVKAPVKKTPVAKKVSPRRVPPKTV